MQPVHDNIDTRLVYGHEMQIRVEATEDVDVTAYINIARSFMVNLVKECSFNQIPHMARRYELSDGTIIEVTLHYGVQIVDIYPAGTEEVCTYIYMDSGAIKEGGGGFFGYPGLVYPVRIYTDTALREHEARGTVFSRTGASDLVAALFSKRTEKKHLCCDYSIPAWVEPGELEISGTRYNSSVYYEPYNELVPHVGLLDILAHYQTPSWRFTGVARLLVQAKYGAGRTDILVGEYPDHRGIIYSSDGRFYYVSVHTKGIDVRRLRLGISQCIVDEFTDRTLSDPAYHKLMAYMLSTAEFDPDHEEYTIILQDLIDYESLEMNFSSYIYNWHFSYLTENECSKVVFNFKGENFDDHGNKYYETTLLTVRFTIPSIRDEEEYGGLVTAQVSFLEQEAAFWPHPDDLFWTSLDENGYIIHPIFPPVGKKGDICGDDVAIYCFYGHKGLQVVRYTAPEEAEVSKTGWGIAPSCVSYAWDPVRAPGNMIYGDACGPSQPYEEDDRNYTQASSGFRLDAEGLAEPMNTDDSDRFTDHSHDTYTWEWSGKVEDPGYPPIVDNGYPSILYWPSTDACSGVSPQFGGSTFVRYTRWQITLNTKNYDYIHDQKTLDKACVVSAGNPDAVIFLDRETLYRKGYERHYSRTSSDWLISTEHISGPALPPYGDFLACSAFSTTGEHKIYEKYHDEYEYKYNAQIKGVRKEVYLPEKSDTWDSYLWWSTAKEPIANFFRAMETFQGSMVHTQHVLPAPVTYEVGGGFAFTYEGGPFHYVGHV